MPNLYLLIMNIGVSQARASEVEASMPALNQAWYHVRDRLKGELLGARAPPGSPNGAMSPLNPRSFRLHISKYLIIALIVCSLILGQHQVICGKN